MMIKKNEMWDKKDEISRLDSSCFVWALWWKKASKCVYSYVKIFNFFLNYKSIFILHFFNSFIFERLLFYFIKTTFWYWKITSVDHQNSYKTRFICTFCKISVNLTLYLGLHQPYSQDAGVLAQYQTPARCTHFFFLSVFGLLTICNFLVEYVEQDLICIIFK